jgi:hypothetical protein
MEGNKRGRKNLYNILDIHNKLDMIKGWAREGITDKELYEMLGVGKDAFYNWKKDIPEFTAALLEGREKANGELLNRAFMLAMGHTQTVTEPMKVKHGESESIEMVTYEKHIQPNAAMMQFMLKNRMPNRYKDKQELDVNANVGVKIIDDIPEGD